MVEISKKFVGGHCDTSVKKVFAKGSLDIVTQVSKVFAKGIVHDCMGQRVMVLSTHHRTRHILQNKSGRKLVFYFLCPQAGACGCRSDNDTSPWNEMEWRIGLSLRQEQRKSGTAGLVPRLQQLAAAAVCRQTSFISSTGWLCPDVGVKRWKE